MLGKLIPHYQMYMDPSTAKDKRVVERVISLKPLLYLEISGEYCPTGLTLWQLNPFRYILPGGTVFGIKMKNWWFADNTVLGFLLKVLFEG